MGEYINFEAEVEHIEGDEVSDFSDVCENSFIDDTDQDTDVNFYRGFTNVENDIKQVLQETYEESLKDLENLDKISNLCYASEEDLEIDDFKNFELDIIEDILFPKVDKESQKVHNQICYTILYALKFDKNKSADECNVTEFQKTIDCDLIDKLLNKFEFIIDLQKFENMCYEINCILSKYGYFLRIFELKNKYRRLPVKNEEEQNLVRQLSSCLVEKCSGFTQICLEYKKKQRKLFKPIDIFYKPTKHIEIESLCFFSNYLSKVYSSSYSRGEKKRTQRAHKVYQCYYFNKFFIEQAKQDNFNAKGDVPFVVYFDFETTAPTFNSADPEQKKCLLFHM